MSPCIAQVKEKALDWANTIGSTSHSFGVMALANEGNDIEGGKIGAYYCHNSIPIAVAAQQSIYIDLECKKGPPPLVYNSIFDI